MTFFHSVHTRGGQCIRRLLFAATFIAIVSAKLLQLFSQFFILFRFQLSSLVSIAIGLWVTITKRNFECLVGTRLNLSVAILLIVFGFFSVLICGANIYAVRQELRCLLYTVKSSKVLA